MNTTIEDTIKEIIQECNAGRMQFGQAVKALIEAGVESYLVDYRASRITYYMPSGTTFTLEQAAPEVAIATNFDQTAIQAAIRAAQTAEIMYPEFKRRSQLAGCVQYSVWLAGRHVAYLGRKGEVHIEPFPPQM